MRNLVEEYVHEEILYRTALASGLDKDDTIIRRRLVEKMDFLAQGVGSETPPENDLKQYFQLNRQRFAIPAQVAFEHIYFSTARRGEAAGNDARSSLGSLNSRPISAAKRMSLGDPFMLQREYPLQTEQQTKELFGSEFAYRLFQLKPDLWAGPLRSAYGVHLVRILRKLPQRLPEFAEVRNRVLNDFQNERLRVANQAFYQNLRKGYRVEVDAAAPRDAEPLSATTSGGGSEDGTAPEGD
jgi:hypothetical protein